MPIVHSAARADVAARVDAVLGHAGAVEDRARLVDGPALDEAGRIAVDRIDIEEPDVSSRSSSQRASTCCTSSLASVASELAPA